MKINFLVLLSVVFAFLTFSVNAHEIASDPAGLHHIVVPHSRNLLELPLVRSIILAWVVSAGLWLAKRARSGGVGKSPSITAA